MAYITDYEYSVDRKTSILSFYDDATPLCTYSLAANVVTISARDQAVIVNPTWGTNRDIKEWFSLITSMSGRYELVEGNVREDMKYVIETTGSGVIGTINFDGTEVGDWSWVESTDTLTIASRVEKDINWKELRLYLQWMTDFQYVVENYGA